LTNQLEFILADARESIRHAGQGVIAGVVIKALDARATLLAIETEIKGLGQDVDCRQRVRLLECQGTVQQAVREIAGSAVLVFVEYR
jgi:hypothetical protein